MSSPSLAIDATTTTTTKHRLDTGNEGNAAGLSRSWNYNQTSVGKHLNEQRQQQQHTKSNKTYLLSSPPPPSPPILPVRRRRREKLRPLLVCQELISNMDLIKLGAFASNSNMKISNEIVWTDYMDVLLDLRSATRGRSSRQLSHILDDLQIASDQLIDHLNDNQLVHMRHYFMCHDIDATRSDLVASSSSSVDNLERIYLRSLSGITKNYSSSISLRFGQDSAMYSCHFMHSPDYFLDIKMYDLNRISSSTSSPLVTGIMDSREAIINIKFYGNQLYEQDVYKNIRQVAAQCISTIERRNISDSGGGT